MKPQTQLSMRLDQRMALLPKMLQSIEVLQLNVLELSARIEAELQQNETLVAEMQDCLPAPTPVPQDDEPSFERRSSGADEEDPKLAMLANLESRPHGLLEHIREQLAWMGVSGELLAAVLLLAECLDERGLLVLDETELATRCGPLWQSALAILRSLEPLGLGARDSIEAMLLQLNKDDPDREVLVALLTTHLESLARNKLPDVARALDLSIADLRELLDRLRTLEPRPGARFVADTVATVKPDVEVRHVGQAVEIRVDDSDLPSLGLDPAYLSMAGAKATERDIKKYLREKLASARALIEAVEQRKRTLARVAAAVMARQTEFLAKGPARIAPLRMSDVAAELDIHTSTVSRTIAGKYIETPHGCFRMRDFFDGGEAPAPGETGRLGVKEQIRRLIADESPKQPLSDDELVALLRGRGIHVARRTVAKYRNELQIKSSWLRRRHEDVL